ncbi:MAG: hypothetical protein V7L05_08520 [Nostoc sp.]|uniref:hypothetical protein n=1 Tax=Nostoc sp. TaxID=1180 RepID=UPI002FF8BDC7
MTERHRPPILKPNEFYTFRSYFQMKFAPADILRELGVTLTKATINLPVAASELLTRLPNLCQRLEEAIARVSLTSEAARREVLIAPILLEVAHITKAIVNIEYATGHFFNYKSFNPMFRVLSFMFSVPSNDAQV